MWFLDPPGKEIVAHETMYDAGPCSGSPLVVVVSRSMVVISGDSSLVTLDNPRMRKAYFVYNWKYTSIVSLIYNMIYSITQEHLQARLAHMEPLVNEPSCITCHESWSFPEQSTIIRTKALMWRQGAGPELFAAGRTCQLRFDQCQHVTVYKHTHTDIWIFCPVGRSPSP